MYVTQVVDINSRKHPDRKLSICLNRQASTDFLQCLSG